MRKVPSCSERRSSPVPSGVRDRFGDSGAPWELIKEFEVSAEHIAPKAVELIAIARMKKQEERFELMYSMPN
jgi:hypothetical protein